MSLNNLKRAYYRDPISFKERVQQRAKELAEKGYSIESTGLTGAEIETDKNKRYQVDPINETCTCWCFKNVGFCKHVLGLKELAKQTYRASIKEAHAAASEERDGDAFAALRSAETLFRWASRVERTQNPHPEKRPVRRASKNERSQGKLILNIDQVFPPAA